MLCCSRLIRFMCGDSDNAPKRTESIGSATALDVGAANSHAQHTYFAISDGNPAGSSSVWNNPELLAVRVEYEHVKRVTKVSTSGLIEVWKGRFNGEDVTIRWLSDNHKHMHNAVVLATEAKTMARLSHPKITAFIGVAWSSALRVQIVTEFMDSGDLATWLGTPQAKQLTWADGKCQIAVDVAEAISYVNSVSSLPERLCVDSHAFLVDSAKGVKLSCFNFFQVQACIHDTRSVPWMAPEVLVDDTHTAASDVYSLGVILSELDTHTVPYADTGRRMIELIFQIVRGTIVPSFTPECPQPILSLARSCLALDPAVRPSIDEVLIALRKIQGGTS